MKTILQLLQETADVSDYKINIHRKESYELFFVKGKLETVRCTDTSDKEVTVYVDHGEYKGDAQFFVYPYTTDAQIRQLIQQSVAKAQLICNLAYTLPGGETGEYTVESNFSDYAPAELASHIADAVFAANTLEHAALNSVEIFITRHTEHIRNSRGLDKTQIRYDAMVEAIPTYNGAQQSVELYEQYNFSSFEAEAVRKEISQKMAEVKARYEAVTPDCPLNCDVVLNAQELEQLFFSIARNLNYATVYSHSNLYSKGDAIQKAPAGDILGVTMTGAVPGSVRSASFDGDGMTLSSMRIIDGGKALQYYGGNRYGQYLGESPTGNLRCMIVDAGSSALPKDAHLEVISMSGLQVDFYSDYIGGEIRLAYYYDGNTMTPVTGISISGKLSEVLEHIRLTEQTTVFGGYRGPEKAILSHMKIF